MTKAKIKMMIDIAMSIALFVLMSYQFTGQRNHEIAGAVMLLLWLLHLGMNYRWYVFLGKGSYPYQRCVQIAVDFLLLFVMVLLMVSGIGMSRYIFRFLDISMSASLARSLHMVCSYTCFLLTGMHLGMHLGMIGRSVRKLLHLKENSLIRKRMGQGITLCICLYGVYALIKRRFFLYMTLEMHYVFFDYEEPVIFYEIDLLAIMILMVWIGGLLMNGLFPKKKEKVGHGVDAVEDEIDK